MPLSTAGRQAVRLMMGSKALGNSLVTKIDTPTSTLTVRERHCLRAAVCSKALAAEIESRVFLPITPLAARDQRHMKVIVGEPVVGQHVADQIGS